MKAEMRTIPASFTRVVFGLTGIVMLVSGAWILWGVGGALLAGGIFLTIDCSADEAIERLTLIKRVAK